MKSIRDEQLWQEPITRLSADCSRCCGLCCAALYFSKAEGFPADKPSGIPCRHLDENFSCDIHKMLAGQGLKGCLAYDCFGAGQTVTEVTFGSENWRDLAAPEEMFDLFLIQFQLHEIMWYLTDAVSLIPAKELRPELIAALEETDRLTKLSRKELKQLSLSEYRSKVNILLKKAIEKTAHFCTAGSHPRVRAQKGTVHQMQAEYMGYNFRGADLSGKDFTSTLLIASKFNRCTLDGACFLGADLRGADLSGADLQNALFLTQMQLGAAKGSPDTRLPSHLSFPLLWKRNL